MPIDITFTVAPDSRDYCAWEREDGGQALIATVSEFEGASDECFFLRLQSWDVTKQHTFLKSLAGKKFKLVEVPT